MNSSALKEGAIMMGEKTEYEKGDKAPNPGMYTEVGEARSFHTEIQNPQHIKMEKGDTFPETSNKNRKWKKVEKARVH
ncbi:hypothetical protein M2110_003838 [Paenibacillus sp. PastF-4]|nr:hypothetical protein [Paenibacillus sp. PastF-4]